MPYINVQLSQQQSPEVIAEIGAGVTSIMVEVLHKARHLVSVQVQHDNTHRWFVGDKSIKSQPCETALVEAFITEGTNTFEEKQQAIAALSELMKTCLGELHEASYIVLHEIPATDWGHDGVSQNARRARS